MDEFRQNECQKWVTASYKLKAWIQDVVVTDVFFDPFIMKRCCQIPVLIG
jgi:hypothetical protein